MQRFVLEEMERFGETHADHRADGIQVRDLAAACFGDRRPTRAEYESIRRATDSLWRAGYLDKRLPQRFGPPWYTLSVAYVARSEGRNTY